MSYQFSFRRHGLKFLLLSWLLGQSVCAYAQVAPAAGPVTVTVSGAGANVEASGTNYIYNVTAGSNYNYTITGFHAGDQIVGIFGITPSVVNTGVPVGGTYSVGLSYATPAGTLDQITLVGLSAAQDAALFNAAAFNTVFGAGTLTTGSATPQTSSQTIGTISFSPATLTVGGTATVAATASSGLAASFSSTTPSVCSVSGSTVTGVAAGTCTIAANQAGNSSYSAAPQVTQSITIASNIPVCTLSASPASITSGSISTLTASCTPAATSYAWTGGTCVGDTVATCAVTPTITTTYTVTGLNATGTGGTPASSTVTVTVATSQTISFGAAPSLTLGGTGTVSATASSGLTVSFISMTPNVCSVSGGIVTGIAAGTCTIAANQAGNITYAAAPQATQSIQITQLTSSQTIGAISLSPTTLTVGGTATVSATASSGLAVSFTSMTPNACSVSGGTVTGIAAGTCTIAANQSGNAMYGAAPQATQSIQVTQSISSQIIGAISFSPTTLTVGGTATVSATASSGLAVSFSSQTPNVCSVSGNIVSAVAAGTCTIAANQAGNASYSAAAQVTQSINNVPSVITLSKSGTGSGTVTSADGNINCGSTCNASYSSVTSVTLTATPASGSTFNGWDGACSGTGVCNVTMSAAKNVTAIFNPVPFTAVTTGVTAGIITAPVATVTTAVSFKPTDVGKPQNVYITAWVPSGSLTPAQQASIASYTTRQLKPLGATTASTFVLVQLTQSGWQPVVNGQLIPYVSGVLGAQSQALTILDKTDTTKLLGSQFCVGYGTTASDMTAAGRMQLVATVQNQNATKANTGSCNVALPISNARVFAYAEANYASLFSGTVTPGQYQQYNFRYYAATQNYLAVDNQGVVFILGPVSNNAVTSVAPVDTFRSVITAWEGAP